MDPADAGKVPENPLEVQVFLTATWEDEFGPALDVVSVRNELGAIVPVDHAGLEEFELVGSRFVIEYSVDIDRDAVVAARPSSPL